MKKLSHLVIALVLAISSLAVAEDHQMQHGFVLSRNDTIMSHLVAHRHHSFQVTLQGSLKFMFARDQATYELLKKSGNNKYYLFQAQNVQINKLPNHLSGHIVEMELGQYEPNGRRIDNVTFVIDEVLSSFPNPFFGFEVSKPQLSNQTKVDDCFQDCGRSCLAKPIFCGQW